MGFFLLSACLQLRATHIVGGELFYDYLGKESDGRNSYRVTLIVFRDCGTGTADFDGIGPSPALITVLDSDGNNLGVYNIGMPQVTKVPPTINSPCMSMPSSVCVEQGVYVYTLTLEPLAGGQYVIYQRCCRNNSIQNLALPGQQGTTYYAFIPGPESAAINSSPRFVNYPPIFLCNGFDFNYTQAATDPDGDQLIYKFSTPYQGLGVCCPAIGSAPSVNNCSNPPPSCPSEASAAPYQPVIYAAPYSAAYPAPSNPSLAIQAMTGAMSGAPSMSGQFVVNVSVEEYRNGKLINRHFRDFQFNMLECSGVMSQFKVPEKCQGYEFLFTNTSFNGQSFFWDFGIPGETGDTSLLANPTVIFPDTGLFTVTLVVNRGSACSDTSRRVVRVFPPLDVKFDPPARQCFAANSFSFEAGGKFASTTNFDWRFPGAEPDTVSGRSARDIHFNSSGTYFIQLTAKHFACIDSFIDTVRVLPMPKVEIGDPGTLCVPASVKLRNVVASDVPLDFRWKTSNGQVSTLAEPQFAFDTANSYTTQLIGTAYQMCHDTNTIRFSVYEKPAAGFEVFPEKVTVLEPEVNIRSLVEDAVHYLYYFGDGSTDRFVSGSHAYHIEGVYTITQYITNFFGCIDSATRVVSVLPEHRFWVPSAFTPDNNSLNDTFGPFIIGVSGYELMIFDRWGNEVFHSSDAFVGWDGTHRGKKCPQGVYTYKLSFKNTIDGRQVLKMGHVSLLRNE